MAIEPTYRSAPKTLTRKPFFPRRVICVRMDKVDATSIFLSPSTRQRACQSGLTVTDYHLGRDGAPQVTGFTGSARTYHYGSETA